MAIFAFMNKYNMDNPKKLDFNKDKELMPLVDAMVKSLQRISNNIKSQHKLIFLSKDIK